MYKQMVREDFSITHHFFVCFGFTVKFYKSRHSTFVHFNA